MTTYPIEEALEKYEYSIQVHDEQTCTLRDRNDKVLVDKGTSDQCYDKLLEIWGEIEVHTVVVMSAIYFWRAEAS